MSDVVQGSLAVAPSETDSCTIALHAEKINIAIRSEERITVRVATVTHVREQVVDVPLSREVVEVEHVVIGRVVDAAPAIRYEGDVTILPVVEEVEVVVIERRLLLKEEIHVRRRRVVETHSETISLRHQTAVVTRFAAGTADPSETFDATPSDSEPLTGES